MNIGDTVGSYRIVGNVGEGGMGSVFLAEHTLIGRYAAIKVLHRHLADKEDQVNRFFNEARATSSIKHPGILEVFDFGWHTDGSAYIVMEYLEGESLEARIQRMGKMSVEHALHITRQVAGALGAAHALGVIHRDLKPENVIIVRDPEVAGGERIKILDFGIAKMMNDTSSTRAGALIGTPDYMAPEQCRGSLDVDHRIDFYSLGCILFRMLCGRAPFVGEGVGEVLAAHLHLDTPRPSSIEPSIEPLLEGFILQLLAKDPNDRFSSAAELIVELDTVWVGTVPGVIAVGTSHGVGRPSGKSRNSLAGGPSTISSASMELPAEQAATGNGSKFIVAVSTAAVLVAGGVVFAVFGMGAGHSVDSSEAPPVMAAGTGASAADTAETKKQRKTLVPVEQITVVVESDPEGADVFRVSDGLRVGKTPYRYTMDPMEGELVYTLKLEGYEQENVALPANADGERKVELKKIGGKERSSRRNSGPNPFDEIELDDSKPIDLDVSAKSTKSTKSTKSSSPKSAPTKPKKGGDENKAFNPFGD